MNEALKEAKKAYNKNEVPVGCVIVKDGKIISRGYNERETKNNALAHAEIIAINKACKKLKTWRLLRCKMYVTLMPCDMCKGAIKEARINEVIYGAIDDKKEKIADSIFSYYKNEECENILKDFFKKLRNNKATS